MSTAAERDAEHIERCRAVQRRSHYNRLVRVIQLYETDDRDWVKARLPGLYKQLATVVEAMQYPADQWHRITMGMGSLALLAAILCTWLGNIRALRQGAVS